MRYFYPVVALSFLIVLHELGHAIAARLLGIRVERFAFGFGPALLRVTLGHTEVTLGSIPFGGAARIRGMNPHASEAPVDGTDYARRPPWQRLLVLGAGSFVNCLVAIVALMTLHLLGTHVPVPRTLGRVEPGSEAARAQLRPGDVILEVNGAPLGAWSELVDAIEESAGVPVRLRVSRQGEAFDQVVIPRADFRGAGRIGVRQQYVLQAVGLLEAIGRAFEHAHRNLRDLLGLGWRILLGRPGADIVSPIPMVTLAADTAGLGLDAFLRVLANISLVLALFHAIPLPSLDGGRMAFVALEWLTGRRPRPAVETLLHTLGFLALTVGLLSVAGRDVYRAVVQQREALRAPPSEARPDAGQD